MSHVGVCGTDVHYWQNGLIGPSVVKGPVIPGHEGAGIVCKVGEGVKHLKVGMYHDFLFCCCCCFLLFCLFSLMTL